MIPIRKQIKNNKQKRAALVSCTLLRLWGVWLLCVFYGLFYLLFATKQKEPQKLGIKLSGHFMMSTIHSFLRWLALSMIQVPRIIPDCL